MIRILIVDNEKSPREKLQTLLEQQPNLQVVCTVKNGYAAFEQITNIYSDIVDIVLMNLIMSSMDGLIATEIICKNYPHIKLIGWSTFDHQDLVSKFLQVGGKGYLLKDTPIDELAAAITLVHQGYIQISPRLTSKTEKNISGVLESTPQVQAVEKKANFSKNGANSLKQTFSLSKQVSANELDIVPHTPASIVPVDRQINNGTIVPIEVNELLPTVSAWTILGGLVTASAIAIATLMAMVTQYKVVVKGEAIVRPAGELRLVQAATEGAIIGIFTKINQSVKRGDIIAILDSSQLQTQASQMQTNIQQAQLQLIQIKAQIKALKSQIEAETDKIDRDIASAKAEYQRRLREYQDRKITTVAEVEEEQANLKLAQDELTRYQQLIDSGAISQLQLSEKQAAYNTAQARLKRVQTALNPSDAEAAIALETIAQQQATGKATLATLNKEQQALIQQRIEINKLLERDRSSLQQLKKDLETTKVKATADGIIAKLNLRNPGQTVRAGEEIAQIVPINSALEIKAQITPQNISKVRLEQAVDIRISACPYPDYGTLSGVVSKISPDALTVDLNNTILPSVSSTKAVYEATIAPDSLVLSQGNKQCPLQLGMEGRADIITNQETVWQFILRKARLSTNL